MVVVKRRHRLEIICANPYCDVSFPYKRSKYTFKVLTCSKGCHMVIVKRRLEKRGVKFD